MVRACPEDNTASVEQENFWDGNWDAHKVGWLIAGVAAVVTCCITLITITGHARNYNRPREQRQIIRVLLFPAVYAVISFFGYRFFRSYQYYYLVESVYEAIAIASFLLLLLQYMGERTEDQVKAFAKKDKRKMPLPFCCFRFRPSKAYFLVLLKWSVVQYCFIRPAVSVAGIVTEYYEVYCDSKLSYKYSYVYLTAVDFASITIALYGLFALYVLVKDDLKGKRILAKFMTIKLGIFLIFYQGFIFDLLADHGALHATAYWTTTNISDGLNALCTALEMVLISAMQLWAFHWSEYKINNLDRPSTGKANARGKTNIFRSILHALNFLDLFKEAWNEIVFLFDRMRGKEYTRHDARMDFVQAFQGEGRDSSSDGSTMHDNAGGSDAALNTAEKQNKSTAGGSDVGMAETGHAGFPAGAAAGSGAYASAMQPQQPGYGSGRSEQTLMGGMAPQQQPMSQYAQAEPASTQPFTAADQYRQLHAHDNTHLAPNDANHSFDASGARSRPMSWEPQAM